ncbi:HupE/UreJ protein [Pseudoduganella flava]|nr:HupE/UreJ protein [Pseudoduganella flava]
MLLAFVLMCWGVAQAHPSPQSEVLLEGHADRVRAVVTLPLDELALALKRQLVELPSGRVLVDDATLAAYLTAHIRPVAPDGRAWLVKVDNVRWLQYQRPADVVAVVTLRPPAGAPLDRFTLGFDAIAHEVQSHLTLVSLRPDPDAPARMLGVLRFGQRSIDVRGADPRWWAGMPELFKLGMTHIAEGTDHLLFLLTLLLPAAAVARAGRWERAGDIRLLALNLLRIVTAFTLGHSLTLMLGAVGAVGVPERPVEVAIAASILVSALHAWRPLFPRREGWIAAGFGLVHGLAFASAIRELELSGGRLAAGVLAFNLGIETVQVLLVGLVAPLLVLAARSSYGDVARRGGALVAGAMAVVWITQRV